jgi:hypothetical protein
VIIFVLIHFLFYMVMSEIRDVNNELHRNTCIGVNSRKLALEDAVDLSQDRLCSE